MEYRRLPRTTIKHAYTRTRIHAYKDFDFWAHLIWGFTIFTSHTTTNNIYLPITNPTNYQPFLPTASLETSVTSCSAYRIFCLVPPNIMTTKLSLKLTTTFWTHFTLTSRITPWWWWTSPRRKEGSWTWIKILVTEDKAQEGVDLAIGDEDNLVEDILGISPRSP